MFATPRALEVSEIEEIIQRFATGAAIAEKAGFAGVQIHGAHGYLVSQFLSPHHNIGMMNGGKPGEADAVRDWGVQGYPGGDQRAVQCWHQVEFGGLPAWRVYRRGVSGGD